MEYLLKASAVIAIFYVCYKIFLQRETFFNANRLFLITGLVVALCVPFIVIPNYIEITPTSISDFVFTDVSTEVVTEKSFNFIQFFSWLYLAGFIVFFVKLLIDFLSLSVLLRKHKTYKKDGFRFIETSSSIAPFSFFNWIVFNPKQFKESELNHIINHEKAHAKQQHSVDVLLSQIASVVFWFNPFIWLYKKEVQQNLEFIADKNAQENSDCQKSYQLVLLKSSVPNQQLVFTNNFYNSLIKKRIVMLHKSKSNKLNSLKYFLVIPLLAFFVMSFNTKTIYVEKETPATHNPNFISEASVLDSSKNEIEPEVEIKNKVPKTKNTPKPVYKVATTIGDKSIITKDFTDADFDKLKAGFKAKGVALKFKGIKRNKKGEITAIKIEGKSENGSVSYSVSSDDEAIKPIKLSYDAENDKISIGDGHSNRKAYLHVDSDGKHKMHKSISRVIIHTDEDHDSDGTNIFEYKFDSDDNDGDNEEDVIIIKNGKKVKTKITKHGQHLEIIKSDDDENDVEIIFDQDHDGKKIKHEKIIINGGNGQSIWIDDEDDSRKVITTSKKKVFISSSSDNGKSPLFIIDGKEVKKDEFENIDSNEIKSVNVLKNEKAIELYGNKGKDGVIIVTTK